MNVRCGDACPWIARSPACAERRCEGVVEVPPYSPTEATR